VWPVLNEISLVDINILYHTARDIINCLRATPTSSETTTTTTTTTSSVSPIEDVSPDTSPSKMSVAQKKGPLVSILVESYYLICSLGLLSNYLVG